MKKLERDLGEYEKSKPETGFKLKGDEEMLFKYLREGQGDEIKPSLVLKVNKALKKEPLTLRDNKLEEMFEEEMKKLEEVLESVKGTWKKISYCFDEELRRK